MTIPRILGLRHLALRVTDIKRAQTFYEGLFGMRVVWQPDDQTVYLSSGLDNLALHQIPDEQLSDYRERRAQFLDHFGVVMATPEAVDALFQALEPRLERYGGRVVRRPKQHRDGSYSFYLDDPDGNTLQVLFEPNISQKC